MEGRIAEIGVRSNMTVLGPLGGASKSRVSLLDEKPNDRCGPKRIKIVNGVA
jgi:hypothetical protein